MWWAKAFREGKVVVDASLGYRRLKVKHLSLVVVNQVGENKNAVTVNIGFLNQRLHG